MKRWLGELILLTASLLWGTCFVFQKMGMDFMGPFTLSALRFLIGGSFLLPVIFYFEKKAKKETIDDGIHNTSLSYRFGSKNLYLGGIFCGVILFMAASLQQIGLQETTAGKAGFLTSLELVFVAIVSQFLCKKLQINVIIGVLFSILGMYFLCISEQFRLTSGDSFELAAVIFWGIQILAIDHFAKKTDVLKLSFIQFMTTGILSFFAMLMFENPTFSAIYDGIIPILYTAIIEVAIAYTLQVVGQKYTTPFIAALILSLEAVFAALSGAILLGETLTNKELLGCAILLFAVIISQVPVTLYQKQENTV